MEVNGTRSAERIFRAGLPQGSVLAPTLYTLWAADLILELRDIPATYTFMYADDTATLSSGCSIALARERAQCAADTIAAWATRWKMVVAGEKTQVIVLSQWAQDSRDVTVKVAGAPVKAASTLRLLGVAFDRLLHFGPHCAELRRKVRPRTAQLGSGGEATQDCGQWICQGALEYAASVWLLANNTRGAHSKSCAPRPAR